MSRLPAGSLDRDIDIESIDIDSKVTVLVSRPLAGSLDRDTDIESIDID